MRNPDSQIDLSFANAIQDFNKLSVRQTNSYQDWIIYLFTEGLLIEKVDDPGQYIQPGSTPAEVQEYLDTDQTNVADGYPVFQWDNYPDTSAASGVNHYSHGAVGHVTGINGWYYDSLDAFNANNAYPVQYAFGFRKYKGLWLICQADLTPTGPLQNHPPHLPY